MKKYLGFILWLLLITNIAYAASTVGEANLPVSTTTATTDNVRTVEGGLSKQAAVSTIGAALGITAGADGTWAIGSKVNSASPGYTCGAVGSPAYGYWHVESGGVPYFCYNEDDYRLMLGLSGTTANRILLATAAANVLGSSSGTTLTEASNSFTLTNGTATMTCTVDGCSSGFTTSGLTAGRPYYVSAANTLTAADATSAATLPSPAVCVAVSATLCVRTGSYTTTGLTAGAVYYVPVSVGAVTTTAPSASGNQVQRVGVALSTTVLLINPSLDVGTVQ